MINEQGADQMPPDDVDRAAVRVFISYAHDDTVHENRVRDFWSFLREQGIDARADFPAAERRQDWADWMTQEVRNAMHVLVVASRHSTSGAEGDAEPGEGRGVQWEARLIRNLFYADQQVGLQRFLPVVLPGCSADDLPLWMSPAAATKYQVSAYTVAGAEKLLRLLTGQPWETEPPVGPVPFLPSRHAASDRVIPPVASRFPGEDRAISSEQGFPGRAASGADHPSQPGSLKGRPRKDEAESASRPEPARVIRTLAGRDGVVATPLQAPILLPRPAQSGAPVRPPMWIKRRHLVLTVIFAYIAFWGFASAAGVIYHAPRGAPAANAALGVLALLIGLYLSGVGRHHQ